MTATTSSELALVVLAAGTGSRYGGLKQLEPVGPSGETLLEYSVFDAIRSGLSTIVLVIRRETEEAFRQSFGCHLAADVTVSYVYQELSDLPGGTEVPEGRRKPWGTGHAILSARNIVRGSFVVINADDFYGRDAFRAMASFMTRNSSARPDAFALAGFELGPTLSDAGPVSRGLCRVDEAGWLERIVEVLRLSKTENGGTYTDGAGIERSVAADDLVSMNMWGFTPAVFPELESRFRRFLTIEGLADGGQPEFLIPDVVQGMISANAARVRVLRHHGRWCGITYPEDRLPVREFIAALIDSGAYPHRLWCRGRDH